MSETNKLLTKELHNEFKKIQVYQVFTAGELSYAAYEDDYQKRLPKVRHFLSNQYGQSVEKTGNKTECPITGRSVITYRKIAQLTEYVTRPLNIIPDEFYDYLYIWNNKLANGASMTCGGIKAYVTCDITYLNEFLLQLVSHGFAQTKPYKSNKLWYTKLSNITIPEMESKFVIYRKTPIKPEESEEVDIMKQEDVTEEREELESSEDTIDLSDISSRRLGDMIFKALLSYKTEIDKLKTKNDLTHSALCIKRREFKEMENNLKSTIAVLERNKANLEKVLSEKNENIKILNNRIEKLNSQLKDNRLNLKSVMSIHESC